MSQPFFNDANNESLKYPNETASLLLRFSEKCVTISGDPREIFQLIGVI